MTKVNLNKILRRGKALFLAYDQGLEHGPSDFNDKNVDPDYIIKIAKKGGYTAMVFQKGIAEKYKSEIRKSKVPLILKLNGKTNLFKGEPISRQLCTVDEAVKLGAKAVGYTIYIGSDYEDEMLQEFEGIQRQAHKRGLPVITWIYPRGKSIEGFEKPFKNFQNPLRTTLNRRENEDYSKSSIKGKSSKELMAYATRTGLEIGSDIIKIQYDGNMKNLAWAVKNAGKAKVVVAGGMKKSESLLLKQVKDIMNSGCIGLAIGRNVWQAKDPLKISKRIKEIIWDEDCHYIFYKNTIFK